MKVVEEYPPNYAVICAALGTPPEHAVFTYGDAIYNPSGRELLPDVIYHESIHAEQQGNAPDLWYTKYLSDPDFRYEQELEAYGKQYQYAVDAGARGKMLDWLLEKMALALSGAAYGTLIEYGRAASAIKRYARNLHT